MRHEPKARTPGEAEKIGDALLFIALLGPLVMSDRSRMDAVDVAFALLNESRLFPAWWDATDHDRQLSILQFVQMPARAELLVLPRWKYMNPKAQDAFTFRLRQKIRSAVQVLGRAKPPGVAVA